MSFFSGIVGAALPVIGGAVAGPVGASIGAGISGNLAAQATNAQTAKLANQANEFNANQAEIGFQRTSMLQTASENFNHDEAQLNRQWQEQMSNTQYQRAVGDMEAAGLNPMLAYSQGGAGTPSGATASVSSGSGTVASPAVVPQYINPQQAAINSASQVANIDNTQADSDLKRATAAKTAVDAQTSMATAENLRQHTASLKQQMHETFSRIANIDQDTLNKMQQHALIQAQDALTQVQTDLEAKRITNVEAQTRYTNTLNELERLGIPKATLMAKPWELGGSITNYLQSHSAGAIDNILNFWTNRPDQSIRYR